MESMARAAVSTAESLHADRDGHAHRDAHAHPDGLAGREAHAHRSAHAPPDAPPAPRDAPAHPDAPPAPRDSPHKSGGWLYALGEEIAELSAQLDSGTAQLLRLIREFDEREGWSGHPSCAHWLNWRTGLGLVAAREKVRVARALGELPMIDDEFQSGQVSYSKVRAITRIANAETEADLLELARSAPAHVVESVVRGHRSANRADEAAAARRRFADRFLHTWPDSDGMLVIRGRLSPEVGAAFEKALEAAVAALREGEWRRSRGAEGPVDEGGDAEARSKEARIAELDDASAEASAGPGGRGPLIPRRPARPGSTGPVSPPLTSTGNGGSHLDETVPLGVSTETDVSPAQRRADALALIAECALAAGFDRPGGAERTLVVVHVDAAVLGDPDQDGRSGLEDGTALAPDSIRRLACDASVLRVAHGPDGGVLDVGRKTRTLPTRLRRALRERDGGCRYPGCTYRRYVEGHHVKHWADGGETRLDNLVELCSYHHRALHEGGFTIERARTLDGAMKAHAGADFVFRNPEGEVITAVPPGRRACVQERDASAEARGPSSAPAAARRLGPRREAASASEAPEKGPGLFG